MRAIARVMGKGKFRPLRLWNPWTDFEEIWNI